MPELPEVETIKKDLFRAGLCGRVIQAAELFWHRTLALPPADEFFKEVAQQEIKTISRRGKYLILNLDCGGSRFLRKQESKTKPHALHNKKSEAFLIMHLRMSGRIDLKEAGFTPRKHDRARLIFEDGSQLLFHDTRKFGRWYFVDAAEKIVGKLGIEPLDKNFTAEWLAKKLEGKSRMLKPLLLDQALVAGIGNIYADEALWYAKLNPQKNSSRLKAEEVKALHAGIVKAIAEGIRNAGTSMGVGKANFYSVGGKLGNNQELLNVFRRTGEPCPRCRAKIKRIVVGQRSTHFCPKCQKGI